MIQSEGQQAGTGSMKIPRRDAIAILPVAISRDKEKIKNGWKWMKLGKTSCLTNPKNFESKLEAGYKFVNKK